MAEAPSPNFKVSQMQQCPQLSLLFRFDLNVAQFRSHCFHFVNTVVDPQDEHDLVWCNGEENPQTYSPPLPLCRSRRIG
jgi:hypothetical protein